jgi:multiple antibiotic resistance protein
MLWDWILLVVSTSFALLPIANPVSAAPVFLALSDKFSPQRRAQQARRAVMWMSIILIVSLLAGALILEFFGISMHALRIAGGLVVAQVGFGMMRVEPAAQADLSGDSGADGQHLTDISFTPMAMPMLSGPGSIAVTISMATEVERPLEYFAVASGILVVAIISWLFLRGATRIGRALGATGLDTLNRLMGFLLICIGVQFIGTAVLQALSSPEFLEAISRVWYDSQMKRG